MIENKQNVNGYGIRLHKVVLQDFKNIHNGEVVIDSNKDGADFASQADIIGIYGQNGSGKTSLIEALALLKSILSGNVVDTKYTDCIAVGKPFSYLEFTFHIGTPNEGVEKTIVYSFKISKVSAAFVNDNLLAGGSSEPDRIRIFDEMLSVSGMFDGEKLRLQPIVRTDDGIRPFGPLRKQTEMIGRIKDRTAVEVCRRMAEEKSMSFIFSKGFIDIVEENCTKYSFFEILLSLRDFARRSVFAISSKDIGTDDEDNMPLNTRYGRIALNLRNENLIPSKVVSILEESIGAVNEVLKEIVPSLTIKLINNGHSYNRFGEQVEKLELHAYRDGITYPLRYESAGIIKLISLIILISEVFSETFCVVAIDEFDAGIFEYLLGELLSAISDYGKGQFIFTSHNLRPLEVLSKDRIVFTTTNPDNRYYRLKYIGSTNNLRDVYLSEIQSGHQDEQMYKASKNYKIIRAFLKAGDING